MSRDQGRYLLVILLLLAAAGAVFLITQKQRPATTAAGAHEFVADVDNWQRTERERVVSSPYDFSLRGDLKQLPLQLGDWTGVDVPQTNLEVSILLEPEQHVQRYYQRPDGSALWLSLIGSRKSKSFHSPQICYDTDGWQTESSSEAMPLAQGEVYALQLKARKTVGQGGIAEHLVFYFYLWPSYARNLQDGVVLVKVTAPVEGSTDKALSDTKLFLAQLFASAHE